MKLPTLLRTASEIWMKERSPSSGLEYRAEFAQPIWWLFCELGWWVAKSNTLYRALALFGHCALGRRRVIVRAIGVRSTWMERPDSAQRPLASCAWAIQTVSNTRQISSISPLVPLYQNGTMTAFELVASKLVLLVNSTISGYKC